MKTKRILCALLGAVMAVSVLGGCSSKEPASSTPDSQGSSTAASSPDNSGTEENTPVTVFCPNTASMPMTNDILVVQQLSEITHTDFDFTVSPSTGTGEKFNLMMSSGEVPDMVIYVSDPILKYYKAFAPLNDLIHDYCPN